MEILHQGEKSYTKVLDLEGMGLQNRTIPENSLIHEPHPGVQPEPSQSNWCPPPTEDEPVIQGTGDIVPKAHDHVLSAHVGGPSGLCP